MMEADDCCPLCMEELDVTDRNFRPCKCGYQICLFCYRHIKEDLNGLCPACRTPYDDANITYTTPDPAEMARLAREKKAKELKDKKEQQAKEQKEKRESELKIRQEAQARAQASASAATVAGASSSGAAAASAPVAARPVSASSGTTTSSAASCSNGSTASAGTASRPVVKPQLQAGRQEQLRDMATLRTSQRAIVYVMGLSPRIAKEEILRRHDYFGQYGKIMRIQVSPAGAAATSGPPSLRCCITYATREEAEQAVLAVDNVVLDGRTLKASFGLPKPPPGPLQPGSNADGVNEDKEEIPMKEDTGSRNVSSERPGREPANNATGRGSDRGAERNLGWDGSHVAPPSAAPVMAASAAPNANSDPICTAPVAASAAAVGTIAVPHVPPEAMPVPPPPEAPSRRAPGPPPPIAPPLADMANDCGSAVGMGVVGAPGMGPIGGGVAGMRAMDLARGSSLLSGPPAVSAQPALSVQPVLAVQPALSGPALSMQPALSVQPALAVQPALSGPPAFASQLALAGQPTGSESEPWSMMGSFEDLLNGLVSEEPDEEETTLPGSSRFARFFSSSPMEDTVPAPPVGGGSALAALGGIKLDTPFEPAGGKQQDDLQQGFRALLPNVNISFSPFGDRGGPQGNDGLAHGQVSAAPALGAVGGLGGLTAFGSFSAPVGCLAQPSAAPVGPAGGAFGNGNGGSVGVNVSSFDMPAGLTGLGSAALNGGSSLPSGAPSTSEVSLLHQLSGPLPGAQLPGSQLSSQLQSLLQGANGSSSAIGSGRAVGSGVGGGAIGSAVGSGAAETNGRWSNGRTADGLMSSWLPSDALLSAKSEDAGAPASDGLLHKEPGGGSSARGGKKEGGGGDSRGGKGGKKRGGTNNRSNKGSDAKPAHGGGGGK